MSYGEAAHWYIWEAVDRGTHAEVWARSVLLDHADQRYLWCRHSDLLEDTYALYPN